MSIAPTTIGAWVLSVDPFGLETRAGDRVRHAKGKGLACDGCKAAERPATTLELIAYLARHEHRGAVQ